MISVEQFYTFIEDAVTYFSREDNIDRLLEAQKEYGRVVREITQEDPSYDLCMSRFYEWYLFDYKKNPSDKQHIEVFLEMKGGDIELEKVLKTVKSSLFEFYESRFLKKNVFKNLQTGESFQLVDNHPQIIFIDHDLLLGHAGMLDDKLFFLEGVTSLSRQARKVILKESKRIKKLKDDALRQQFLYQLEQFDLRYRHYHHVPPEKIYKFSYESDN